MKVLIALATLCLGACAWVAAPAGYKVSVEGEPYVLSELTAGTWTAISPAVVAPSASRPSVQAALVQAIEQASGCKVTGSDYSREGRQLNAQVDCGSRLKN